MTTELVADGTRATAVRQELVGSSPLMRRTVARLLRHASTSKTVLIRGETGVGKELMAELLATGRGGLLVVLNCGALPRTLIESELFGHEKGAFTGALGRRMGAFEEAHGGTLFLDEIGEVPNDLQAKLLRVLETRRVRRLGSSVEIEVDFRLVTATHRDLEAMVASREFRQDLLYRIDVLTVDAPPLRDHLEDIPDILDAFANREKVPVALDLREDGEEALRAHVWPGNVRELRNVFDRIVDEAEGSRPVVIDRAAVAKAMRIAPRLVFDASEAPPRSGFVPVPSDPWKAHARALLDLPCEGSRLDAIARELVLEARRRGGHDVGAAALLGESRKVVRRVALLAELDDAMNRGDVSDVARIRKMLGRKR